MASYSNNNNASSSSSSSSAIRNPFGHSKLRDSYPHFSFGSDDSSLADDCIANVRKTWQSLLQFLRTRGKKAAWEALMLSTLQLQRNLRIHRIFSFPHLLVLVWVLVLLWGEQWVFHTTVERCGWSNWEKWSSDATPHRLIFVADPQLIDPHSYPGRPWPLSSLTMTITDNYMRRSYNQLQQQLHPDTVFFLGDLFDGGREWKTNRVDFEDPPWNRRPKSEVGYATKWKKKYGQDFWLREYLRFNKLFTNSWNLGGSEAGVGQRGRKLIASLPGNHDIGFGSEVKNSARDRFEAYFGDVNRVDVVANHTFVSLDTLSLSARTSEDMKITDLGSIYRPTEEFLDRVQLTKRKAVERELRRIRGESQEILHRHSVETLDTADFSEISTLNPGEGKAELPTILLTHVPLFRPPGTACGPFREHWPPSNPPQSVDHRNAISVSKGYQYQNVLNEPDSLDIVKKVGNVIHVFSGDDHDYCELTHDDKHDNVKEITVKSISMAMGVPTPGFLMVSMYNPIDGEGKPLSGDQTQTLQTHLCLLPNQLSTYARYGGFAFVCLVMLSLRALLVPILNLTPFALEPEKPRPFLPAYKAKTEEQDTMGISYGYGASASSYHSAPQRSGTRDRSASFTPGIKANGLAAQARNAPPKPGGGNMKGLGRHSSNREKNRDRWEPKIEIDLGEDDEYSYDAGKTRWKASSTRRTGLGGRGNLRAVIRELWTTAWRVLWMVGLYWGWLAWKG